MSKEVHFIAIYSYLDLAVVSQTSTTYKITLFTNVLLSLSFVSLGYVSITPLTTLVTVRPLFVA